MASPLRVFRKYQYIFLVAFGVMLMFAFVIAPPLSDYLETKAGTGSGANPVVVVWKGGELTERELSGLKTRHLLALRFLSALIQPRMEVVTADVEVIRAGEVVRLIKGRSYQVTRVRDWDETYSKPRNFNLSVRGQEAKEVWVNLVPDTELVTVEEPGISYVNSSDVLILPDPKAAMIPQASNEEELVRRFLLAEKAREMGVRIGEDSVLDYFDRLFDATGGRARPNYEAILNEVTNGRLGMKQLIAQITLEMSAQRMLVMGGAGLNTIPPHLIAEAYEKVNRRVKAELLPIDVAGFVGEVGEPSDADLRAVYQKGKDQFPFPNSPDPGFKRRERVAFGYFKAAFDTFLEREMEKALPTVTDEAIENQYKDNPTRYMMPVPEAKDPADAKTEEGPETSSDDASDATQDPAAEDTASPAKGESTAPEAPAKEKTKPEPAGDDPPKTKPAVEPAVKPAAETKPPVKESADPKTLDKPVGDQTSLTFVPTVFVSHQAGDPPPGQEPPAQTPPAKETAQETAEEKPAAEDPPAKTTPETEPKSAPAKSEPAKSQPAKSDPQPPKPAADPTTPKPDPKSGDAKEPVEKPDAAGEIPSKADDAAAEKSETVEPPEPVRKRRPLDDELREEIRKELAERDARPAAREKVAKAIDTVRAAVEKYGKSLNRAKVLENVSPPAPLDMAALAEENGLVYNETPRPMDVMEISQIQADEPDEENDQDYYELLRAQDMRLDQQTGYRTVTILDIGFGEQMELYSTRSFSMWNPVEATILFWRTEVIPEEVPDLDDIRDKVVDAWKKQQALPLAKAAADEMVKKAQQETEQVQAAAEAAAREVASKDPEADMKDAVATARREAAKPLTEIFPDHVDDIIQTQAFSWISRGPALSVVEGIAGEKQVTINWAGNAFMESVFALRAGEFGRAIDAPEQKVYVVRIESESQSDSVLRGMFLDWGYLWASPKTPPRYMGDRPNPRELTQDVAALVQETNGEIIRGWYLGLEDELGVRWERDPLPDWGRQQ